MQKSPRGCTLVGGHQVSVELVMGQLQGQLNVDVRTDLT